MFSLGRCLLTTNISLLLLDVRSPRRWAWPGVQGCREHILSTRVYRRQQVVVSFTIVHSSCVSRGLSVTTRYYLLVHPLSNHVRPPIQLQHTDEHTESSRHYSLPKSQHTPLLRNPSCRQAVELALNGTHNNFLQIICYLLISARTLLVQEPGSKLSYRFLHVFFRY